MLNNFKLYLLFLTLLTACMVGPDYQQPELPYDSELNFENQESIEARWWHSFKDPILNEVISSVINDNLDIKTALSRIAETRAMTWELSISTLPEISLGTNYTRSKSSAARVPFVQNSEFRKIELYRVGLDASWEIDLFGRSRRAIEAAGADEAVVEANLRDVIITAIAEAATSYFGLRASQEKLDLVNAAIRSEQQNYKLIQSLYEIGEIPRDQLLAKENYLLNFFQQRATLQAEIKTYLNALEVITGGLSQELYKNLKVHREFRVHQAKIKLGSIEDLFKRRPDIRAAESSLAAASARIGVAKGNLFPKITLAGDWGYEVAKTSELGNFKDPAYAFVPQISWKIFNIEETIANIKAADARYQTALTEYHKTMLTALNDLEDKVELFGAKRQALQLMQQSTKNQVAITRIARSKFEIGSTSKQDRVNAQQELITIRTKLLEQRLQYNQSLIALYKSLGGGWEGLTVEDRL